jgi:hypothetical protein
MEVYREVNIFEDVFVVVKLEEETTTVLGVACVG